MCNLEASTKKLGHYRLWISTSTTSTPAPEENNKSNYTHLEANCPAMGRGSSRLLGKDTLKGFEGIFGGEKGPAKYGPTPAKWSERGICFQANVSVPGMEFGWRGLMRECAARYRGLPLLSSDSRAYPQSHGVPHKAPILSAQNIKGNTVPLAKNPFLWY